MRITQWAKDVVLRLARVPAEPHVPEGADESVRVFNAGRNYFAWRVILWGLGNMFTALGLLAAFVLSYIPILPPLVHEALSWLTLAVCVATLWREYQVLAANNRLIEEAGLRRKSRPA